MITSTLHPGPASRRIGLERVPGVVVDAPRAEPAMIDENLMRAELSAADRAAQTARRKAIYLELHRETARGRLGRMLDGMQATICRLHRQRLRSLERMSDLEVSSWRLPQKGMSNSLQEATFLQTAGPPRP